MVGASGSQGQPSSLTRPPALATAAANPPQLNPVPSAPAGGAITYDQLLQLFNLVIAAIRENGGEIVIGDDVIGRANARYMQDRSIMTGGAVF